MDLCLGDSIVRLDLSDGRRVATWDSQVPLSTRPGLSHQQTLLVGAEDGSLFAFIEGLPTPFFRSPVGDTSVIAWPVVSADGIAVLCKDGTFSVLAR